MNPRAPHVTDALLGVVETGGDDETARTVSRVVVANADGGTLDALTRFLGEGRRNSSVLADACADASSEAVRGLGRGRAVLVASRGREELADSLGSTLSGAGLLSAHTLVREWGEPEVADALLRGALGSGSLDARTAARAETHTPAGSHAETWCRVVMCEDSSPDSDSWLRRGISVRSDEARTALVVSLARRSGWEGSGVEGEAREVVWRRVVLEEVGAAVLAEVSAGLSAGGWSEAAAVEAVRETVSRIAAALLPRDRDLPDEAARDELSRWVASLGESARGRRSPSGGSLDRALCASVLAAAGALEHTSRGAVLAQACALVLRACGLGEVRVLAQVRAQSEVLGAAQAGALWRESAWECTTASPALTSTISRLLSEEDLGEWLEWLEGCGEGDESPEEHGSGALGVLARAREGAAREHAGALVAALGDPEVGDEECAAIVEELCELSRRTHEDSPREVDPVDEAVCAALLVLERPWSLRRALCERVVAPVLDSHLARHGVEDSERGDETLVEVLTACPYVAESDRVSRRKRSEEVCQALLTRLLDPDVTHPGLLLSGHDPQEWRAHALSAVCSVITPTPAQVGWLPWSPRVLTQKTRPAVGAHLREQLGGDLRAWELLAVLGEDHEGSVGALCAVVRGCLAEHTSAESPEQPARIETAREV